MMGVMPLEYLPGQTADTLGLDGTETFEIAVDGQTAHVTATKGGHKTTFDTNVRFDTPTDWTYYQHGGILPLIVQNKLAG